MRFGVKQNSCRGHWVCEVFSLACLIIDYYCRFCAAESNYVCEPLINTYKKCSMPRQSKVINEAI